MAKSVLLLPVIALVNLVFISGAASQTKNFKVIKFELCNKTQGLIKVNGNVTTENGKQYLTFDVDMPIPWDDNLGSSCSIQTVIGSKAVELFMIKEKNYCKAVHKYMGEFWYDIERAAQIMPGLCPIPAGSTGKISCATSTNEFRKDYSANQDPLN